MVKSLNLGLKVKILGPLLAFMGVGGPARAQARVKGVTVGWVGPQASERYILLTRQEASARPASRSGAQPILEYQSSNVIYSLGKCLANQSQPCCTVS